MDVTDGLADKLPAMISTLLKGVQDDEASAILAFQKEVTDTVTAVLQSESDDITKLDMCLTAQRETLFVELGKFRDDTITQLKGLLGGVQIHL